MRILLVLDRVENSASANALMAGWRSSCLAATIPCYIFDPLGRPARPARPTGGSHAAPAGLLPTSAR